MHRKVPRSPEESLVCWAEWRKGFILVTGEGKGQHRAGAWASGTADCQCTLGFQQGLHALQAGYLGPGSAGVLAPCWPEPLLHNLARGTLRPR